MTFPDPTRSRAGLPRRALLKGMALTSLTAAATFIRPVAAAATVIQPRRSAPPTALPADVHGRHDHRHLIGVL